MDAFRGNARERVLVPLKALYHEGEGAFSELLPITTPGSGRTAAIQEHLATLEPAPTVGRIVMYCFGAEASLKDPTSIPREHPAIVTRVFAPDRVNLHVFFDSFPSQARLSVPKRASPLQASETGQAGPCWRWPDRG